MDSKNHTNQFQTSSGVYVDINLDDLQDEINAFKSLEASSSQKTTQYNEISQKIKFLEEQGKWLEDVAILKAQLDEKFYDGFNIRQFKTTTELNNIA
jgi:hypothetical protein